MKMKKSELQRTIWNCHLAISVTTTIIIFLFIASQHYSAKRREMFIFKGHPLLAKKNPYPCITPEFYVDDSTLSGKQNKSQPAADKYCDPDEENWVACSFGTCSIKEDIVQKNGRTTCSFQNILRKSDIKSYLKIEYSSSNYTLIDSDFVKVQCQSVNGHTWSGSLTGVRKIPNVNRLDKYSPGQMKLNPEVQPLWNIVILGISSLNRVEFQRKLPEMFGYLTGEFDAHILSGFQGLGDDPGAILLPLLVGKLDEVLPENHGNMDNYPFLWKNYKKKGYVTAFNDDMSVYSVLPKKQYKFYNQPTDHYLNTFVSHASCSSNLKSKLCIGATQKHKVTSNYIKKLMLGYKSQPIFACSFYRDKIDAIGKADKDLVHLLKYLWTTDVLKNTVVIVLTHQKNELPDAPRSLQQGLQARMPFVSFKFPDSFKFHFPNEYDRFLENIDKLTTAFDIHETLVDILEMQEPERFKIGQLFPFQFYRREKSSAGISLFKRIPNRRSCWDAHIPAHLCVCLNLRKPKLNDSYSEAVVQIVAAVRERINSLTEVNRDRCEILDDGLVEWLMELTPSDKFLKSPNNNIESVGYQLYKAQVLFGKFNMLYEVLVWYSNTEKRIKLNSKNIVRINVASRGTGCLKIVRTDVVPYCYCKSAT